MTDRLRVQAIVSGRLSASSRFRVLQHVDPLRLLGVDVHAHSPRISKYASLPPALAARPLVSPLAREALEAAKLGVRLPAVVGSWRAEMSWLEREVLPGRLTLEPLMHRPLLFDVDDAIWLLSPGHERAARTTAARAACVLAGNDFLAEWFSEFSTDVERVWTAVDTERFTAGADNEDRPFVVGWTGSASTMAYLQSIAAPLARFLAAAPEARLMVIADVPPALKGVPSERVTFVPWSPAIEAVALRRFDVGLMPLPDSLWTRGKCAFKMLQYLSCAVPAVVSPVGMNEEVLAMADCGLAASEQNEWVDALMTLRQDRPRARAMGQTGRALVEERFSVDVISRQLAAIMHRCR